MACVNRAYSSATNFLNSAGVEVTGSAPWRSKSSRVAGVWTTFTSVASNLSRIGLGVRAGAIKPIQPLDRYPATPDSMTVGSSGVSGERCAPAVASARNRPARTWLSTAGAGVIVTWDSLPISAVTDAPPPL